MKINNRYKLFEQLGQGGMGAVYLGLDRLTGNSIALKRVLLSTSRLPTDPFVTNNSLQLALAREFKILASLRHPHIISVLD